MEQPAGGLEKMSAQLEKALSEILSTNDPLDAANFDPIDYINQKFPNEQSLSGVDAMLGRLQARVVDLDAEILTAVQEQAVTGAKARQDLENGRRAISELFAKIKDIKSKAEESETMVQEICKDIKSLDYAKRNLTTTITALKRLVMLVTAVDQLREMARERQYKETANLLEAVTQLCEQFEEFKNVPKIADLLKQRQEILRDLRAQLFEDFACLTDPNKDMPCSLSEACLAVDAMGFSTRRELLNWFCSAQLEPYLKLFTPGEEAGSLSAADRRFGWIRRLIKEFNEKYSSIFPASWQVPQHLLQEFCNITRQHMVELVSRVHEDEDVTLLVKVLQLTIKQEGEFQKRFGSESEEEKEKEELLEEDRHQDAASIRAKYKRQSIDEQRRQEAEAASAAAAVPIAGASKSSNTVKTLATAEKLSFRFNGAISECFEPYLQRYVDLEEKFLRDTIEKAFRAEKQMSDDQLSQSPVFPSCLEMFSIINNSLKRCSAFSKSTTLYQLFHAFKRVLKGYCDLLHMRIPTKEVAKEPSNSLNPLNNAAQAIVNTLNLPRSGPAPPGSSPTGPIKTTEVDEIVVCYIINTAENCVQSLPRLVKLIQKTIDPSFVEKVNLDHEADLYAQLTADGLEWMYHCMEGKCEPAFSAMSKKLWNALEDVGDQSDYIDTLQSVILSTVQRVSQHINKDFFASYCDKVAERLVPRFIGSIYKCKKIGDIGSQQLLVDANAFKAVLLRMHGMNTTEKTDPPPRFIKYVNNNMGKAEAILKVIGSPIDKMLDNYRSLQIEDKSAADFERLLALKGAKRQDHPSLMTAIDLDTPPNLNSNNMGAQMKRIFAFNNRA